MGLLRIGCYQTSEIYSQQPNSTYWYANEEYELGAHNPQ